MSADPGAAPIAFPELRDAVRAVEPAVLFLPSRLLRRVIKLDRGVPGLGLLVPHRRSLVLGRDRLLELVDPAELGVSPSDLPDRIILIACPNPDTLATAPRGDTLRKYWRTLFHARVHLALEGRLPPGAETEAAVRDRVACLGRIEFAEIRSVLNQDDYLLPPADDREVFVEFTALYLELRHFYPGLVPCYFPGLDHPERVDELLARDLDAAALLAATRLPGASDPAPPPERGPEDEEAEPLPAVAAPLLGGPDYRRLKRLKKLAKRASGRGNAVRAAVSWRAAAEVAPAKQAEELRATARAELGRLAARLAEAVGSDPRDAARWRKALAPLLRPAALGFWPPEARLLYDLQKACVDHERELFAVDLVEWVLRLGRRPLRRPVPCQRAVLKLRHLRGAVRRLRAARVAEPERARLADLLQGAVHDTEEKLRDRFRPHLRGTLEAVGLVPRNLPERVAQNKLVEELLDRIADAGYLTLGDLRDALSRNGLKLPDLGEGVAPAEGKLRALGRSFVRGAGQFFLGDRLIRADRRLALVLDGVYRRGEIYLRWLQRLSALAFATVAGRFLTLYFVLPFGTAFISLKGLYYLLEELHHFLGTPKVHLLRPEIPVPVRLPFGAEAIHLRVSVPAVALGCFIFGLLHVPPFRRLTGWALLSLYRGLRWLVADLPALVLGLPAVRAVLDSRPFQFFRRYVLKPLVVAVLTGCGLALAGVRGGALTAGSGGAFAVACLFLNTRLGRDVEELLTDLLVRVWRRVNIELVPAFVHFTLALFRRLVEGLDRWLYRVDEWLRFRQGESWLSLVVKPVLGVFWFFVTYLVRVYVNLLIEPTFNPIKHFPVVTVAAKLLLPFSVALAGAVAVPLAPVTGGVVAKAVGGLTVVFLPGFFGFLVWELKENWRLYEANRPRRLRPDPIGHHGETMARLLRPGFHSGTVPKLFTRWRRAERAALPGGSRGRARKQREALHHVGEAVGHFAEREFLFLLNESGRLGGLTLSPGEVRLSTNRVAVAVRVLGDDETPLEIVFEEDAGRLLARLDQPGGPNELAEGPRHFLGLAFAGLVAKAAADDGPVPLTWAKWVAAWETV